MSSNKQFDSLWSAEARSFKPSAIRAFASLINDPKIISFAGGLPSPLTFPAEKISLYASVVLREQRDVTLQYGATKGLPSLREFAAEWTRRRGVEARVEEVMITTGSQQALDLVSRSLLDPGDVVLVELPTYIGATSSFHARQAELAGVEQDDDGIDVDSLDEVARRMKAAGKRVKFLYTIPNFQNPSGRLLSPERRSRVLEVAARHGFMIIEDDPYGELVFDESAQTTPIKAADRDNWVIYLSSFSKVLAPGLRCGWIVAPESLLRKFELAKEAADLCSGMLDQSIVSAFCAAGEMPAQLERVRSFYRDRRDVLMTALHSRFDGKARWTEARGGLFTLLTLNDDRDTREWVPRAIERGVAYIPGGAFFVDGSRNNTMRLTFAKEPDDRMREGVERLADLFFGA
ncbi:MAG TPA: PLP-dependent aminotransferase family protein [Thermoanaerobaculia bacterium]|nr:PLP-dependent aminotransferase family protein [Thermoanaerobaculia bacterium]